MKFTLNQRPLLSSIIGLLAALQLFDLKQRQSDKALILTLILTLDLTTERRNP
jgi:hypothetical protein